MKPRDLTGKNWDIQFAVFEAPPGFEARVTADGKEMWFRVYGGPATADVTIPIREFRKMVDFIADFDLDILSEEMESSGKRTGSCYAEIIAYVGQQKRGQWVKQKTSPIVRIASVKQYRSYSIQIRLSLFRKLLRWYNSDI